MQNLTTKLPPKIVYQQQTFRKRSFIPSAAGVFSLDGAAAARHCSKSGSFANEPWFSKRKNGLWSSPLCFRVGGSMGGGVSSSLRGNFEQHWGILKTVQCPPLWRLFVALTQLRATKQSAKNFTIFFKILFRNAECVRIFWVYAPKNFPIENFWVRSDLRKVPFFTDFLVCTPKKSIALLYPQFWCHWPSQ